MISRISSHNSKRITPVLELEFSHEETGYIRALLKEHLDYYRLLAGNPKCSHKHRRLHELCEKLMLKLLSQDGTYQSLAHDHGH
jgi:hypothetical protein